MVTMEITVNPKRIRKMNKIKYILIGFCLVVTGLFFYGAKVKAYTEEEKQQAKAWLSAHGYSPDAGGASAAYQDYLNGKFDEELGITRETTEQSTGSEQSAYDDYDDSDDSDEKSEKTTETEEPVRINSAADYIQYNSSEQKADDAQTTEMTTEEVTTEITTESSTQIAYDDSDDEDAGDEEETDEESDGLLKEDNGEHYKEAIIVVVLSVLVIIIGFGVFTLLKK